VRKSLLLALMQLGFLVACGGGGYTASGGGGGGGGNPPPTQNIATPGPPNVETLVVDGGPSTLAISNINTAYVSVKVCTHGSTVNCLTIDHVEVDTGSSGLRVLYSALNGLILPSAKDAGGNALAECLQFADGSSFGSVAMADITLPVSTESASNINLQVIGDPTYAVPSDCTGTPENTVDAFGANGILGVGPLPQDCGDACVSAVISGTYYSCPTPSTCAGTTVTLQQQVPNPVTAFGTDNNGVIVELPSVGATGTTSVSGSLVFGIDTRSNNGLGSATVLLGDATTGGYITATYKGTAYSGGYLDSGSNGVFFTDSTIAACTTSTGFYCPSSTLSESVMLQGTGSTTATVDFSVANAESLFATANYNAFSNLGGPVPTPLPAGQPVPFDLGMSFFYGHNVYTAIIGADAAGFVGPYFAF
jgi:uncharacterized protein DUF3443